MADLNLLKKFHIMFFFHLANLSVHCAATSSCLALSPKYKCAIPGTTGLSARSGTVRYRKKVVFVHSVLQLLFQLFILLLIHANRRRHKSINTFNNQYMKTLFMFICFPLIFLLSFTPLFSEFSFSLLYFLFIFLFYLG